MKHITESTDWRPYLNVEKYLTIESRGIKSIRGDMLTKAVNEVKGLRLEQITFPDGDPDTLTSIAFKNERATLQMVSEFLDNAKELGQDLEHGDVLTINGNVITNGEVANLPRPGADFVVKELLGMEIPLEQTSTTMMIDAYLQHLGPHVSEEDVDTELDISVTNDHYILSETDDYAGFNLAVNGTRVMEDAAKQMRVDFNELTFVASAEGRVIKDNFRQ